MNKTAQAPDISFDRSFDAAPGTLMLLSPEVRRIVAANPGPMTFSGTCTYVVGHGEVAVIDPGPDLPQHVAALIDALGSEKVRHILVTHTHADHCGAAARLKATTGAEILGCGLPKVLAADGGYESAHDFSYVPDRVMGEGDMIAGKDFVLETVATPGHTGNHLSFALNEEKALFSGDHVMAWSTSVIIPPDGAMADYMASLDKLLRRDDAIYWPGHGGPVRDPRAYVAALIAHRRSREEAILAVLKTGALTINDIVAAVYRGLDPALRSAAALSVRAHLDDLAARGCVRPESSADTTAYRLI